MNEPVLQMVEANGLKFRVATQGTGPAVLLCHGFPESWYSWRRQLAALADAGYRAIAPDMRGYGQSDKPEAVDQYSMFHLVGDMVGILDALNVEQAVVIGHDWGAPVAWHAALWRPDRFRAVGGLSVPFLPRGPVRPSTLMPETDAAIFYQTYFQTPGVAEAELERDVQSTMRNILFLWSGDFAGTSDLQLTMVPRDGDYLANVQTPVILPDWVTETDVDFYVDEFRASGFRGPLNWYRNIDRNWEQMAPWNDAKIHVPALFMIGDRDPVITFRGMNRLIPNMETIIPGLREKHVVPGCGHWIQREKPEEVNAVLLRFLASLS